MQSFNQTQTEQLSHVNDMIKDIKTDIQLKQKELLAQQVYEKSQIQKQLDMEKEETQRQQELAEKAKIKKIEAEQLKAEKSKVLAEMKKVIQLESLQEEQDKNHFSMAQREEENAKHGKFSK